MDQPDHTAFQIIRSRQEMRREMSSYCFLCMNLVK